MSDFKILKCPSCGSSIVETQSESIITCSHCGSNLTSKNLNYKQLRSDSSLIKVLLLVVITLILSIAGAVIWFAKEPIENPVIKNPIVDSSIDSPNKLIKSPLSSMPTLNTKAIEINNASQEKSNESLNKPILSIVSNVAGETSIGGKYWIVTVRNDSSTQVISPRVTVSLFDNDKRRIAEQTGWSKLDVLDEKAETTILVLISKPPEVEFTLEFQGMAALPNNFTSSVVNINVDDFIVSPNGNSKKNVIIVGDVSNPNEFRVDFIKVQAIALNKQGVAVGIADAFVTNPSLANDEKSGFKITASTFISEAAASWSLWAGGRKHREN